MHRFVKTCFLLLGLLLWVGSRHAIGSEIYLTSYFNGTVGKFAADGTAEGRGVGIRSLFTPAVVPEPSTCAMVLAGLACGGAAMWRRRKNLEGF